MHRCTCGLVLNRDTNAARNILQRELGRGLAPWGDNVAVVDASVVPEAALL
ncbi:MAG: transposase [Deinococcota bacterium]|nr:transposase [Deinococcota bacterium]